MELEARLSTESDDGAERFLKSEEGVEYVK